MSAIVPFIFWKFQAKHFVPRADYKTSQPEMNVVVRRKLEFHNGMVMRCFFLGGFPKPKVERRRNSHSFNYLWHQQQQQKDDYDEIVDEARRMVNEISLVVDWRGHLIWEVLFFGYCMVGMLMIAFVRGNSCGGLFLILNIELCWNISLATGA